jgi:3D-(3,5/4)-trihydroxycyclohexane-1,2-dione acylhydrolase (decyclizing)
MDAHKAGAFAIVADARAALEQLTEPLVEAGYSTPPSLGDYLETLKAEWVRITDDLRAIQDDAFVITQAQAIGIVNDAAQARDVVVCAAGGMPGDLLKLWRPQDPKSYHVEYGYSCMGYEIAGGLGVKMADPSREVFVMVGDGSYLMIHTEIVTSLQEHQKLIVVVIDNSSFKCIRELQMSTGSPSFGNDRRYRSESTGRLDGDYIPIDFAANGASLGAVSYAANSASELRDALQRARQNDRTTVVHVSVDKIAGVPGYESWWDVPVAETTSEASVEQALDAYEKARREQRFYY